MFYDLIRIAANEMRIVYELFDFYTNFDTNLIRISYEFDTNCVYELLKRLCYDLCLRIAYTNLIRIACELHTNCIPIYTNSKR